MERIERKPARKVLMAVLAVVFAAGMFLLSGKEVFAEDSSPGITMNVVGTLSKNMNTKDAATLRFDSDGGSAWRVVGYGDDGATSESDSFTLLPSEDTQSETEIQLDQSDIIMLTSAEGGKISGDPGESALVPVGVNGNGCWKMTKCGRERNSFQVLETAYVTEDLLNVRYSGAATGDSEYISAMIADKDGTIKYYGRMVRAAEKKDAEGSLRILLKDKFDSKTDTLFLFSEQVNGDNKTDYASPLREVLTPAASEEEILEEYPYNQTDPENNWSEPEMNPGDTYDCSNAGWNTSVYIRKPGEYTIKGQSNHVRVMIESTGVRLYLADGLNLNCDTTTYIGSRTAAINIQLDSGEKGGKITIVSKKNATSYLEGYLAPGIGKFDTKTELIFETEDSNNPGTIKAQGGQMSAGIGGVPYFVQTENTTGYMTFNSGNIIATGGGSFNNCYGGAGIGGGSSGGVNGIQINGGNIEAYGTETGAAIGGGFIGPASDIEINGGTVNACSDKNAQTGNTATIGSGGGDIQTQDASGIVINGGYVKAIGYSGTAIGAGGCGSQLRDCVIRGGTVYAAGKSEHCSGIGACYGGHVDINIQGGVVTAIGGYKAPGIGSSGLASEQIKTSMHVDIDGGTVMVQGDSNAPFDIGMDKSEDAYVQVTGGSLLADRVLNPKDVAGNVLHRVDIGFAGVSSDGISVDDAVFSDARLGYGTNQVCTNNGGTVSFWLPNRSDTTLESLIVGGTPYTGAVKLSDSKGTMKVAATGNSADDLPTYNVTFRLKNNGAYIARLRVYDEYSEDEFYTDSCLYGQETEISFKTKTGPYFVHGYNAVIQIWNFGWTDTWMVWEGLYFNDPVNRAGAVFTARGNLFDPEYDFAWLTSNDIGKTENVVTKPVAAKIKALKSTAKKGKKTTIKVTSNSGTKLTVKSKNSKAKKALKKKYVKITNGKTAKIVFTKKAPKGKYTFQVTSPAKGKYKKTTKTITIRVK